MTFYMAGYNKLLIGHLDPQILGGHGVEWTKRQLIIVLMSSSPTSMSPLKDTINNWTFPITSVYSNFDYLLWIKTEMGD